MVKLDCFAAFNAKLIFIVNIILFIAGLVQIGISSYFLLAGSDEFGFVSEIYQGNDTVVHSTLALGVLFVFISCWGCCGANLLSKCMLWVYAIFLFFIMMGQAMTVAALAVSLQYGDSIFADMWKELEPATISDIEASYKCCSFDGNSTDTWVDDATDYQNCTAETNYTATCWEKFEGEIRDNYEMVAKVTAIFLGCQVVIYFATHYVIQSIAEAEGEKLGV